MSTITRWEPGRLFVGVLVAWVVVALHGGSGAGPAHRAVVGRTAAAGFGTPSLAVTQRLAPLPSTPAAGRNASAGRGLGSLPASARPVVSATLGSDSRAFFAQRSPRGGYRLDGGGVAANVNSSGVSLRAGGASLSMALAGIGRGGELERPGVSSVAVRANRVSLDRGALSEWYRAGPLGIEQGFTLSHRPAGSGASFTVELRLAGHVRVRRSASGTLLLTSNGQALRYGALSAVDANERSLRAALESSGGRLLLRVWDGGARYPLTIDPLIQQGSKLTASGATPGGTSFGLSVAVSGDGSTALVGGPDAHGGTGAAWVFTQSGGVWTQQGSKLTGSGAEVGRGTFGWSVGLSADGSTALIGAPDAYNSGSGVAWVFTRSGGVWTQQGGALTPNDEVGSSDFGVSVALSGDGNTALVGGDGDGGVGAAWVFTRSGATWAQQGAKLTGSGEIGGGGFGAAVSLSADGNTALIGGYYDNSGRGAAWVFVRSSGTWTQQGAKLTGSGAVTGNDGVQFGSSVALSGDGSTAIVGGPYDNDKTGAAWVFTRSGASWTQQGGKLTGSDTTGGLNGVQFGNSVALSEYGNTALIAGVADGNYKGSAWVFSRSGTTWAQQGSTFTDVGGNAVALSSDGNTALIGYVGKVDDPAAPATARVFTRSGVAWAQQATLDGTGAAPSSQVGTSVALSADGNTALVGGPDDGDGDGAAWVFVRSGSTWVQQGAKLTPPPGSGAGFGSSVALSADGNTALIGGPNDDSTHGYVEGVGAAWVFTRTGGTWTQQGSELLASDEVGDAGFGASVALSSDGDTALITGPYDVGAGAWVFTRSGSTWSQQGANLAGICCSTGGPFGTSGALSATGDTAVVGGYDQDSRGAIWVFVRTGGVWSQQAGPLTGIGETTGGGYLPSVALSADGSTALLGYVDQSSAWVFTRSGTAWGQQGGALSGSGESGASFGYSVALSADGGTALVGGRWDDADAGAVWVFTRSGSTWSQQSSKLVASDATEPAGFGTSVALSATADTALIGGPTDDGNEGAAWAFVVPVAPGPPIDVIATPGDGRATVSFLPPVSDGSNAVTSYTVTASPGGQSASGPGSPLVVTGLTNGTTYAFTVTATSAAGTGPVSVASNAVTPLVQTRPLPPPPGPGPRPTVPTLTVPSGNRPPPPGQ